MSGGSHNYIGYAIENNLENQMEDRELNDLIKDIAKLAHDLEWYHSGDTSEEDYRKSVIEFKKKWFKSRRDERLKKYINDALERLRLELYTLIGDDDGGR